MVTLKIDDSLAPPSPTSASPQWWGADSSRKRMRNVQTGQAVFIKKLTEAAVTYIDVHSTFALTAEAGAAGIGPSVISYDPEIAEIVMDDLTLTHSTASIRDFNNSVLLDELIKTRRNIGELKGEGVRTASVFDDIRSLYSKAVQAGVTLPVDIPWMLSVLADIELRINALSYDKVLIHGDANASNVAVARDESSLKLLDFDLATFADPFQDVGSLLLELQTNDYEPEELFERYWGEYDHGLFSRSLCYRGAEAVRGGLIGAWVDHCEPGTFEYSKFSDWMFFWARGVLGERNLDSYLRSMK